ncbi:MAG TPA: SdiA-regulated domain-containing protein [Ignavibacteria bacterium]|nr:SdiA-regulated domain-containing protein [Ignavibacteria bacterium]HMR00705.1 SdiA-regulated domain-containing protein [Ignavibacteria bacterium]
MKADRYIIWVFPVIFAIFSYVGCTSKKQEKEKDTKDKVAFEREQKTIDNIPDGIGSLGDYDISSQSPEKVDLPSELIEVSGITFTDDNRLFAHGDEDGDVFEIDVSTGKIIKRFHLGSWLVIKGDFEDIAYAKGKFYLVESNGKLYEFSEGNNGEFVKYKTYKTFLSGKNDVEGLCFDNETNSLLLACKESGGKDYGKDKTVYSFSLDNLELDEVPRFIISSKDIKNNSVEGKFNPSGIAKNPVSGSFYLIAAKGNTIVELSKNGEILDQADLPEKVHIQAEGIAFKNDGTLFISNEGKEKQAYFVVYKARN